MAPHDPARRHAILDAATASFSRYGFRKTTMDQVAHDAGVAKPTLYAWFENKDALFYAVCDALMSKILDDAELARATPDPIARIRTILEAKFTTVFELVASSPTPRSCRPRETRRSPPGSTPPIATSAPRSSAR